MQGKALILLGCVLVLAWCSSNPLSTALGGEGVVHQGVPLGASMSQAIAIGRNEEEAERLQQLIQSLQPCHTDACIARTAAALNAIANLNAGNAAIVNAIEKAQQAAERALAQPGSEPLGNMFFLLAPGGVQPCMDMGFGMAVCP